MTELRICIGSSCHLKGSYNVLQTFRHLIEEEKLYDKIELKATFCMKECHRPGVSVTLNGENYSIPAESAREFFKTKVLPAIN
ncbi:MAG: (2Fe-2S) ferredoxin domain-containing protein [Eubacteriales bacterium]